MNSTRQKVLAFVAVLIMLSAPSVMAQLPCYADFDCDGDVDATDVSTFLSQFGRSPFNGPCPDCYDSPCPCTDCTDCPSGQVDCTGTCVDTDTDETNCGSCGNTCSSGYLCVAGQCELTCQTELTNCTGTCVDTDTDEDNCGSCGNICLNGEICIAGFCDVLSPTCDGTQSVGGRWCDQGDGTVKDMTTGLVWLKKADWGGQYPFWVNTANGTNSHDRAAQLWDGSPWEGSAALSDGSVEGDWRLPTKTELYNLANGPEAVRDTTMQLFTGVQTSAYCTSTTYASNTLYVWAVYLWNGTTNGVGKPTSIAVWPVHGDND